MNTKIKKVYLIQDSPIMVCRDHGETTCRLLNIDGITGFNVISRGIVASLEDINESPDSVDMDSTYLYENPATKEEWYLSRFFIAYGSNGRRPSIKAMLKGETAVVAGMHTLIKYSKFFVDRPNIKVVPNLGYLSFPDKPYICTNGYYVETIHLPIVI